MKATKLLILSLCLPGLAATAPAAAKEPVDYVDPMIGTAYSRWMLFPGVSMPFGMVKLSPDNQDQGYYGGYDYRIENVAGFSHVHSYAMAGLLTMPTTGQLKVNPGPEDDPDRGYRSRFRHDQEVASPGYYAVTLDDYGIRAELTSTTRAGFQRYTFPETGQAQILFDLKFPSEHGFHVLDARVRKVGPAEIEGFIKQQARMSWVRWSRYTIHFVARFSKPFDSFGGWRGEKIYRVPADRSYDNQKAPDEITGEWHGDIGAFVNYSTSAGEVIGVKTGISLVSIEQARLNMDTELSPFGWDFDAAKDHARKTWNELLGKVRVEGGTEAQKTKFYTNMYRAYCGRTIWSDANGKYVDMYENVQQLEDPRRPVYGSDALWNTFWNLNQLWALATPEVTNRWVNSLLEIYDRGGWLPKSPTGIEYGAIMVASHSIPLIVGAYQAGIRDFDREKAYRAIRHNQMEPGRPHAGGGYVGNRDLKVYLEYGYVPSESGNVSNTLEYAYDDWCVAQMAKALGKKEDYEHFMKRAQNYRNVFDPSSKFVRPRQRNGSWVEQTGPMTRVGFCEGNSWAYTFFVPQDVHGLIGLIGGREPFVRRLADGFEKARSGNFVSHYVDHGNQPNMQAAYLFNYAGAPWLTQKYARAIMERFYGTEPYPGWCGDEDQGQMGAWYVLSAIGLFQMRGGAATRPIYEIGSPIFDKITIDLDEKYYPGGQFVIEARNNSQKNVYIQSATLDGEPLRRPWFYHAQLVDGGKLILQMGPRPNRQWGTAPEDAPPAFR